MPRGENALSVFECSCDFLIHLIETCNAEVTTHMDVKKSSGVLASLVKLGF